MSLDYENEIKDDFVLDIEETSYELPDGNILKLSNEIKFKSGEVLL